MLIMKIIHLLINEGTLTFIYYNVYEPIMRIIHLLINTLTFIYYNVYEGYKKPLTSFVEYLEKVILLISFVASSLVLSLSSHFLFLLFIHFFLYTKRKINSLLLKVCILQYFHNTLSTQACFQGNFLIQY